MYNVNSVVTSMGQRNVPGCYSFITRQPFMKNLNNNNFPPQIFHWQDQYINAPSLMAICMYLIM